MQDPLSCLYAVSKDRFIRTSKQARDAHSHTQEERRTADCPTRYRSYYCGEIRGEAVDRLCQDFQDLINQLQATIVENHSATWHVRANSHAQEDSKCEEAQKIVSNQEMILVSALLDSTQRIMHAIQNLAQAIGKMQAYRDVIVTQDAVS
ncbi:hypothetical protein EON65_37325 [archaeon]|nr:MAG: hypothetical protein EON65_37325 [archaeon]